MNEEFTGESDDHAETCNLPATLRVQTIVDDMIRCAAVITDARSGLKEIHYKNMSPRAMQIRNVFGPEENEKPTAYIICISCLRRSLLMCEDMATQLQMLLDETKPPAAS